MQTPPLLACRNAYYIERGGAAERQYWPRHRSLQSLPALRAGGHQLGRRRGAAPAQWQSCCQSLPRALPCTAPVRVPRLCCVWAIIRPRKYKCAQRDDTCAEWAGLTIALQSRIAPWRGQWRPSTAEAALRHRAGTWSRIYRHCHSADAPSLLAC